MSDKTDKTIFRVASRHKPYSQLGNAMMRDKRLSLEAVGTLCFILSFPSNWEFNLGWLMRERDVGRDRAQRIIKELITCGYCSRERDRRPDGTYSAYEYVFSDEPLDVVAEPQPEKPVVGSGKPVTGKPSPVNPPSIRKKDHTKKITNPPKAGGSFQDGVDEGAKRRAARPSKFVSEAALDRVRTLAPGWDRQHLLKRFLDWPGSKNARNMDAAFLAWVPSFTKGRKAS